MFLLFEAYDVYLEKVINAKQATNVDMIDRYRCYLCPNCGEEVYLAAAYSKKVPPYFKHKHGNNNVECEDYSGSFLSESDTYANNKIKRPEVYFNSSRKIFYVSISIGESIIAKSETKPAYIELRSNNSDEALYNLKINRTNVTPDFPVQIPLEQYSEKYRVSNTLDGQKFDVDFINMTPTFFKIYGTEDEFNARLIPSKRLYTNTNYFMSYLGKYKRPGVKEFLDSVEVKSEFSYKTMSRSFSGYVVNINRKTYEISRQLSSWGYQIDESETVEILWPPTYYIDNHTIIDSDNAVVYSTFNLEGNTNLTPFEIENLSNNISRIKTNARTIVYRKNIHIVIIRDNGQFNSRNQLPIVPPIYTSKFEVPVRLRYFCLNDAGVTPLDSGQIVYLTPNSYIIGYQSNYPVEYVYPCPIREMDNETRFFDILAHYKCSENYNHLGFKGQIQNKHILDYIKECSKSGCINSAVRRFIQEGLL